MLNDSADFHSGSLKYKSAFQIHSKKAFYIIVLPIGVCKN